MKKLSHTDQHGKAKMVDVGSKPDQKRKATAEGFIELAPETIQLIHNNQMKKGDVLSVARIAGIQAAKKTSELIPLCHPLFLSHIEIHDDITDSGIRIRAVVKTTGKTGVEMEALTAVNVALLTVYDMCKAVDANMVIREIFLVEKVKE
jgi:cyclic pyranopterin phosphate synthase